MKAITALFMTLLIGSTLLSGDVSARPPSETQIFKGVVESVNLGKDIMNGNISELIAVDGKGKKMVFTVRTGMGVTVSGTDRLINIKNMNSGDRIIVDYTVTRDGINKVMAIECSKPRQR